MLTQQSHGLVHAQAIDITVKRHADIALEQLRKLVFRYIDLGDNIIARQTGIEIELLVHNGLDHFAEETLILTHLVLCKIRAEGTGRILVGLEHLVAVAIDHPLVAHQSVYRLHLRPILATDNATVIQEAEKGTQQQHRQHAQKHVAHLGRTGCCRRRDLNRLVVALLVTRDDSVFDNHDTPCHRQGFFGSVELLQRFHLGIKETSDIELADRIVLAGIRFSCPSVSSQRLFIVTFQHQTGGLSALQATGSIGQQVRGFAVDRYAQQRQKASHTYSHLMPYGASS